MTTPVAPPPVTILATYFEKMASLKVKDIQKMIGRKLTLKEKIGFWLMQQRIRHLARRNLLNDGYFYSFTQTLKDQAGKHQGKKKRYTESRLGQTALVVGIVAAALLLLGLFVPYVIIGSLAASIAAIVMGSAASKQDRSDKKAHAGKLLGWITLILIAVLIIAVAIILASWTWV